MEKIITGIKVTPEFYTKLQNNLHKITTSGPFTPIKKYMGLPIIIDEDLKTDYEFVYETRPSLEEITSIMNEIFKGG